MEIAGRTVSYRSLEVDGVDPSDYPDFCDAFFSYAEFEDGTPLADEELEYLTDHYGDVINELCYDSCVGAGDDAYDRWKDSQYD